MLNEVVVSFTIVAICVVIHATGLLIFAEWIIIRRPIIRDQNQVSRHALLLIVVFAVIISLHLAETALWAAYYHWQRLFADYETSLYFSITCYTTIGFGDVVLPQRWRLLGAVEGVSGVLLCGLSTAFIFAIVDALIRMRLRNTTERSIGS